MFERFTAEARTVVVEAQSAARRHGHGWLGCEHLLLALAGSETPAGALLRDRGAGPESVEAQLLAFVGPGPAVGDDRVALASLGIDLDEVRSAVEATFGAGALDSSPARRRRRRQRTRCGSESPGRPFTPRAKRCLEGALKEALRSGDRSIAPEHVALALLAHHDTVAWEVLARLGVDAGALQHALEEARRRTA